MAQPIRIGSLDFNDIKTSIKNYLKDQTEFSDYNFEGAGITQLINILAYNTHYNALSANFLANEMFLDTAVKRSSIVSRAKELGYTPRSRRAAYATLTVTIVANPGDTITQSITIPRGTTFASTVNDETFNFMSKETVILNKIIENNTTKFRGNVIVYEGVLTQNTATYDKLTTIKIPNEDIDTSTLEVEVLEGQLWTEYYLPQYYLNATAFSNSYMIQVGFNGYEIYFGDGVIGKQPADASIVRMTYIVTSGEPANGAKIFNLTSPLSYLTTSTIMTISADDAARGGMMEESTESIRLNAKNSFGTQNRAVTSNDYASLAAQNFPDIKDILAWDGADNIPPKFGKIVLCIQPTAGMILPAVNKQLIRDFLVKKGVGNVKIEFVDPEYLNLEISTTVKYDINHLKISTYELLYLVKSVITNYAINNIQKFGNIARYSQLTSTIDATDYSIKGNETYLKINKELTINLFFKNSFAFSFANAIKADSILSTNFYDGSSSLKLILKDNNGKLHVYTTKNGEYALYAANVGTINYRTGECVISGLYISSIDELKFKISAIPSTLDVYSNKNTILRLDYDLLNVAITKDVA